jgi:prepilin-type N-terminal cleavage/methylation domain-containing protein
VGGASAPRDRGFTLVELAIAVGVIAMTAATGISISLASRSFAVTAAATEFDQFLDSARTMARDLQGATLVFAPDAYGDGTEVRLLTSGANGTLIPTTLPVLHARAIIEETESLGKPPYAFTVHANGALGGRPGFQIGGSIGAEVGCPASGAFHFRVHTGESSADRYVPCRVALAAAGPVALASWPPAPVVSPPTPCAGGCSPAPLPSAPPSSPSCPPNYDPISGGCAPAPTPNPGAHYHVSISGASPTMTVGTTESFTAQATLTNPNGVAPGTPASIPVLIGQTTSGICTATPAGPQLSGTSFTLNALSTGTCTVTVAGDTSGVAGSTADTASITVAITMAPTPTPTPQACDLIANGKCYHRIVDQTTAQFWKYVVPDSQCTDNGQTCYYVDSISAIWLYEPYVFQPPLPPADSGHELLFKIDAISGVTSECLPYSTFQTVPGSNPITWGGSTIGAPVNAPIGFGQPSNYLSLNHVILTTIAGASNFNDSGQPWQQGTTLAQLYAAVALQNVGSPSTFSYSSSSATAGSIILWYPDFAGCDVAADPASPGVEFGISGVQLLFEIYQASS